MITITHEDKEYKVRNQGSEVTLNELAKISHILESDGGYYAKWLDIIDVLSTKGLSDVIDDDALVGVIENMNITNIENEVKEVIEVNGREYKTNVKDGKLTLSGRDLATIERFVRSGGAWGAKAFAVVYKDVDLGVNEHYTDAHVKHKANLFGDNVTADIAAPVVFQLSQRIIGHVEKLANVNSRAVQGA